MLSPSQVEDMGLDYLTSAARQNDLGSVLYLASAYDTGLNLGSDRKVSDPLWPYLVDPEMNPIFKNQVKSFVTPLLFFYNAASSNLTQAKAVPRYRK